MDISGGADIKEITDKLGDMEATVDGYRLKMVEQNGIIADLKERIQQIESEKERKIEPLLNESNDFPELREMFDSFLSSVEHKIKQMKGEEQEVVMPLDEAVKETGLGCTPLSGC